VTREHRERDKSAPKLQSSESLTNPYKIQTKSKEHHETLRNTGLGKQGFIMEDESEIKGLMSP
jgi:hypothetical protein